MASSNRNTSGSTEKSESRSVQLSVSDFGPIARGTVDLRPLTVFVGPSHSGKTYFAILLYVLHRLLLGIPRIPVMGSHFPCLRKDEGAPATQDLARECRDFHRRLATEREPLRFRDLPSAVRDVILSPLNEADILGADLEDELERCFDLETVADLVQRSASSGAAELKLAVREQDQDLWQLHMRIAESGVTPRCAIENPLLDPESSCLPGSKASRHRLRRNMTQRELDSDPWGIASLLDELVTLTGAGRQPPKAHYLPAARSGIMQSHRVIASSLVRLATQAGLQRLSEFPTLSGVMADFTERLLFFEGRQKTSPLMHKLATALEEGTLGGQIRTRRTSPEAYPEFVYHQKEAQKGIGLPRASSMVSELAPLVLFLREVIEGGDLLIWEEPEAHLHPATQMQMAQLLGRMARAGLQVVVTTHSDWLLKEISNLIREGELAEKDRRRATPEFPGLKADEAGIWLFRQDAASGASQVEEIPFDRIEGIEPQEYEAVAADLYNRSAKLQNRWEETRGNVPRGRP